MENKRGILAAVKEKKEEQKHPDFIKWFSELNKNSGSVAGGKGANLGEMYNLKIPVPQGFAVTAQAYDYYIKKAGLDNKIKEILGKINYEKTDELNNFTKEIREMIEKASMPPEMEEEIIEAYEDLGAEEAGLKEKPADEIIEKSSASEDLLLQSEAQPRQKTLQRQVLQASRKLS
jgi:pyruvate,water dikinase